MIKPTLSLLMVAVGTPALAHPGHADHGGDAGMFTLVLAGAVAAASLLYGSGWLVAAVRARQGARVTPEKR